MCHHRKISLLEDLFFISQSIKGIYRIEQKSRQAAIKVVARQAATYDMCGVHACVALLCCAEGESFLGPDCNFHC